MSTAIATPNNVTVAERVGKRDDLMMLDATMFGQMQRIASLMARTELLPDHLRSKPWWMPKKGETSPDQKARIRKEIGEEAWNLSWNEAFDRTLANCFLVVEQSFRWQMSPFAVAPETYEIGGKLAYQGKLIMALVNTRAGLSGRLNIEYSGDKGKDSFAVTITGIFKDDPEPKALTLTVGEAKTQNQMWKNDPAQKLVYSGVTRWARRFCPEVILGITTVEDAEAMEEGSVNQRIVAPSALDAFAAFPTSSGAADAAQTLPEGVQVVVAEEVEEEEPGQEPEDEQPAQGESFTLPLEGPKRS